MEMDSKEEEVRFHEETLLHMSQTLVGTQFKPNGTTMSEHGNAPFGPRFQPLSFLSTH